MGVPIFRGYDRQALDLQYNNQLRVPRHAEHVARWQTESERARSELAGHFDVPFGPSPDETVDVFVPAGRSAPAPVQVFYHGGYWRAFQARDFSFVARPFVEAGAVAVVVNYALLPRVRMGELLRQCRAALAWVERSIDRYGGDPQRIHVSGHSAGGHIVAQLLAPDPDGAFGPPAVKSATALSGVYDLEPIRLSYLQETLALTEEEVRRYSPLANPPALRAPLAIAYGAAESEEFARHSTELAALCHSRGLPCTLEAIPGEDHMSLLSALLEAGSRTRALLLGQMGVA
ncbi:MAG: alpha/beta hydrolase [Rhodospirillaceae bacterium]|nr:alpha/beta hydrolase [Rhodospirillaceae bacterium]